MEPYDRNNPIGKHENVPIEKKPEELKNKEEEPVLPDDMLEKIFSHLEHKDLKSLSSSNKRLRIYFIESNLKKYESFILKLKKEVINEPETEEKQTLINNLDLYIKDLENITKSKEFDRLSQLGELAQNVAASIFKFQINNPNKSTIHNIEKESPPFYRLGFLSFLTSLINDQFTNPISKARALQVASQRILNEQGWVEEAVKLANKIPDEIEKGAALRMICNHLISNNQIADAIKLANTIIEEEEKSLALKEISNHLINNEQISEGIKVASMIPVEGIQKNAFYEITFIFTQLIRGGQTSKAIELAEKISNKWIRSDVLKSICNDLIRQNEMTTASNLAQKIPDDQIKSDILERICNYLIQQDQKLAARELAKKIPDEWVKAKILDFSS